MASAFSGIGLLFNGFYVCLAIVVAVWGYKLHKSLPFGRWGDIGAAAVFVAACAFFFEGSWYRFLLEMNDRAPRYFLLGYMPVAALIGIGFLRGAPSRAGQPALATAGPDATAASVAPMPMWVSNQNPE